MIKALLEIKDTKFLLNELERTIETIGLLYKKEDAITEILRERRQIA